MHNEFDGKWRGQYTYRQGYPETWTGKSSGFTLEITVEDGIISGHCVDDQDERGTQRATVRGFIEGTFISFVKNYEELWLVMPDGSAKKAENMTSYEVSYEGEYSGGGFSGEWEIELSFVDEEGTRFPHLCDGTWTMGRERD